MRKYNCDDCYIGNGYGGKCVLELPQISDPPTKCPVFDNVPLCNWIRVKVD